MENIKSIVKIPLKSRKEFTNEYRTKKIISVQKTIIHGLIVSRKPKKST